MPAVHPVKNIEQHDIPAGIGKLTPMNTGRVAQRVHTPGQSVRIGCPGGIRRKRAVIGLYDIPYIDLRVEETIRRRGVSIASHLAGCGSAVIALLLSVERYVATEIYCVHDCLLSNV